MFKEGSWENLMKSSGIFAKIIHFFFLIFRKSNYGIKGVIRYCTLSMEKKICQTLTLFCDLEQRHVVFQGSVGRFGSAGCFSFGALSKSQPEADRGSGGLKGRRGGAARRRAHPAHLRPWAPQERGPSSDTRPLAGAGGSYYGATVNELFRRVSHQLLMSRF